MCLNHAEVCPQLTGAMRTASGNFTLTKLKLQIGTQSTFFILKRLTSLHLIDFRCLTIHSGFYTPYIFLREFSSM